MVVEKTGPWITGTAGFEVTPTEEGCRLRWFEAVQVPYLPALLTGPAAVVARVGFAQSMGQLRRHLERGAP